MWIARKGGIVARRVLVKGCSGTKKEMDLDLRRMSAVLGPAMEVEGVKDNLLVRLRGLICAEDVVVCPLLTCPDFQKPPTS